MSDPIGLRVIIPGTARGYGIVKYVGAIEGKDGLFGGLELQGPIAASRGKNNGSVDGIQYFEVSQPQSGLFLPWDRLRSANPRLPQYDVPKSRPVSGSRESLYTPLPPSRPLSQRYSSLGSLDGSVGKINGTGRASPFNVSQKLNLPKRNLSTKSLQSPEFNRSSTTVRPESFLRPSSETGLDTENLESELIATKHMLEEKSRMLREKNEILNELQGTVDELNPLLEDYEKSLEDKNRRLNKQRQEYDRARQEWRQSLDLMLSAQQEAEGLYELQIEELREELNNLRSNKGSGSDPESQSLRAEIERLLEEIDKLTSENASLKEAPVSAPSTKAGETDDEYVELLLAKIEKLTQDVASIEFVMESIQSKSKEKDNRIVELEIQLDELSQKEVNSLLQLMDTMAISDWQQKEDDYKSKLAALEKRLASMTEEKESERKRADELQHSASENVGLQKELLDKLSAQEAQLQKCIKESEDLRKTNDLLLAQVSSLEAENSELKKVTEVNGSDKVPAKDAELLKTIDDLKHELEMRPSFEELTELQTSLEELDSLHRNELLTKQKEIGNLREAAKKQEEENSILTAKIGLLEKEQSLVTPVDRKFQLAPLNPNRPSPESGSLPDPDVWANNDALPIHTPNQAIDLGGGRDDWCGLCEREGHNSLNCPYENDIF